MHLTKKAQIINYQPFRFKTYSSDEC